LAITLAHENQNRIENQSMQSKLRPLFAFAVVSALAALAHAAEPVRIALWENGAPGEPATKPEDEPVLFAWRPEKQNDARAAVIICPGGGYSHLAIDHEGQQVAAWLNSFGVTAFVLRYRHAGTGHKHPVPMLDGQRAIRSVRARAGEWNVDPAKIGVLGFSAGGHLASTLGTHFDAGQADAADATERASSRPDFLVLCYPVISTTEPFMHRGSRDNLIGRQPDEALARELSNELQVTPETPPTFLLQTDADRVVPAENAVAFYLALRRAGVPAELHIYQNGRHGLGLAPNEAGMSTWPDRLKDWLQVRQLTTPAARGETQ
jgi:acetyl esterase/lipase